MRKTLIPLLSLLAATAMLPSTPASAGYVSGAQLLDICRAEEQGAGNPLLAAECLGFVLGVSDTFDCVETLHGFTWDNTAKVSQSQLVKVVRDWLASHPRVLAYEADGLAAAALSEAFPCQ